MDGLIAYGVYNKTAFTIIVDPKSREPASLEPGSMAIQADGGPGNLSWSTQRNAPGAGAGGGPDWRPPDFFSTRHSKFGSRISG
jgi:hypothetical protein